MGFFICLPLLLALASASGQTLAPTREAPRNEPLEFYDNPPAPPRKIETSPRMISQFGPFVSFQVNVDQNGQNIIGDAANECVISVDPTNGNKMTIAWRQFNDVNSNFRQGGWGYTSDGGIHWTFPGVLADADQYPGRACIWNARCGHQRQPFCRWLVQWHDVLLRALEQCADREPDADF